MEKNIDPIQQAVRDEVKAFAEKEIYPRSVELDQMPEPRKFPKDLYQKIGEAGFIGYAMPKELGGRREGLEPVRYGDWEKKGLAIDF